MAVRNPGDRFPEFAHVRLQLRLRNERFRDENSQGGRTLVPAPGEKPEVEEVLHLDQYARPRGTKRLDVRRHDLSARSRAMIRNASSALMFISRSPGDCTLPAC